MTEHAGVGARKARPGSGLHALVTGVALDAAFVECVNLVRKVDRLLRLWLDAEKMFGGVAEAGVGCGECRRTPTSRRVRIRRRARIAGDIGLLHATRQNENSCNQRQRPKAPTA